MEDYARWVGRRETVADVATRDRYIGMLALLDDPGPLPAMVPPLGHWLLARPMVMQSEVGLDGHPRRDADSFLPPIPQSRRMWAGSEVDFLAPIPIDAPVERRTTISAITPKQGRSGAMVFVTLDHEIFHCGAAAVRERQHIVYREPANKEGEAAPVAASVSAPAFDFSRVVIADAVALFRYSALTFNGHRIHYDRDHAAHEGYPGLVVHGPLLATLLLEHARAHRMEATVAQFSFRARAPIFDGVPFRLGMTGDDLSILDANGVIAMTAAVRWA